MSVKFTNRLVAFLSMLLVYIIVMIGYYYQSKNIMIESLELEIKNILITHKAINNYVSTVQKPKIYELKKSGLLNKDFFSPVFLSSTYTNMKLNSLANIEREKEFKTQVIIKYASINPTNLSNLANSFERTLLKKFQTTKMKNFQDIVNIGNEKYLYYAQRGHIMESKCLQCHGDPKNAPKMMVDKYGDKNGFGFKEGALSSILSVRVPLKETLLVHEKEFLWIAFFVFILFIFFFIVSQLIIDYIDKHKNMLKESKKLKKEIQIYTKLVAKSVTNTFGIITEVSDAFCDLTGYSRDELVGHTHSILRHPDTQNDFFDMLWETITNGKVFTSEIKNRKKDTGTFWAKQTIKPIFNRKKEIVAYENLIEDITEKKQLEVDSLTDPLTSLYNRRGLESTFEREYQYARRENNYFSFIMVDIDFFKLYNDSYGHDMGDMVLMKVANEVKNCFRRTNDYVFRVGGEEFGIILSDKEATTIINIANNLCLSIENLHIKHKESKICEYVTVSVGVFILRYNQEVKYIDIYKEADFCLYTAKEKGRNRVEYKK